MIKETTNKIHWVPFSATKGREADTSPAPTATVNKKFGYITFASGAIAEMGADGMFIKFYFEPVKKIIGWQLRKQVQQSEMKSWKLGTPHHKLRNFKVGIGKLLKQFDGRITKEAYADLPIQKYREINPLSEYKNEVFYFVELIDNPEELKKGVGNKELADMSVA